MRVLLATSIYEGRNAAAVRRQARSADSLMQLKGAQVVNLQFQEAPVELHGMETVRALRRSSLSVTGLRGPRKPVSNEIFGALAGLAQARGLRYFAYVNSDIVVTQEAVDAIDGRQSYAYSRTEVDPASGRHNGITTAGVDMFAVEASWWLQNAGRFRPYLIGESTWDNVYTAQLFCHSDGVLLNREALILHETHETAWTASPFQRYVQKLAAYDSLYFSLWAKYHAILTGLRQRGATDEEELAAQRSTFVWRPSLREQAVQQCRNWKAALRYRYYARIGAAA
jgi:hypothetical protein